MGCEKYQRWMSDEFDGELPARKALRLAAHLRRCPSCRLYQQKLKYVQREAVELRKASPPPAYWQDFSARLKAGLEAQKIDKKQRWIGATGWRYAWGGAAIFLLACLLLTVFLLLRPGQKFLEDGFISFESFLDRLSLEVGGNDRLAEVFNLAVVDLIGEEVEVGTLPLRFDFSEDYLFIESLSEEEVDLINRAIEAETKSKGG